MPLIGFSIRLDRIEENLLYQAKDGSFWLSCVCTFDVHHKDRTIVAQSVPKKRFAAGERGPQVGFWREIGGKDKSPAREGKGFDLAKYKAATQFKPPAEDKYPAGQEGLFPSPAAAFNAAKEPQASRTRISRRASMNSDSDMDADSRTLTKEEEWEQPDREAVIRDNPLLEYCQRHGLQLKRDGAANRYKCLCPLHREKTPSFTIFADQGRFHCFGCGRNGNVIDLHAALKGVSGMEALCDLAGIEYHGANRAGSARQTEEKNNSAQSQSGNAESYDQFKDPEKAQKRQGWPVFEIPTSAEIAIIATLRGLSPEGVALAAERGLLFCADTEEGRAWVIADSLRLNAQARRMDGMKWEHIGDHKAWTLPGSIGKLPIGLYESMVFPNIAFVEGGPDLLAAFHLAWCETSTPETMALGKGIDVIGKLGVVAMLGRHQILKSELRHFKGKHIRIFADADEPGLEAEGRWWHQLKAAGAKVDGYSFEDFIRSDGKPVKDLNDFALIDPDQWEAQRDAIEEAFRFLN